MYVWVCFVNKASFTNYIKFQYAANTHTNKLLRVSMFLSDLCCMWFVRMYNSKLTTMLYHTYIYMRTYNIQHTARSNRDCQHGLFVFVFGACFYIVHIMHNVDLQERESGSHTLQSNINVHKCACLLYKIEAIRHIAIRYDT